MPYFSFASLFSSPQNKKPTHTIPMLTLQELKKNIFFFVIMTVVLTLLLSSGVALFNFSFEINREILASYDNEFESGHAIRVDTFLEFDTSFSQHGVSYMRYRSMLKSVGLGSNYFISGSVLDFRDNLPIAVERAKAAYSDFIIDGTLWQNTYGGYDNGFPLFLRDTFAASLFIHLGIVLTVGDTLTLYETDFFTDTVYYRNFILRGIFRSYGTAYANFLPFAVMSIESELAFRQAFNQNISTTYFIINSMENLQIFARFAARRGITITSWILEGVALVNLFSGIFASVAVVILILSGLIAFVYAGMLINKRMTFIGILKAMGMTNFKVTFIYFLMLLLAFIVAFILGNLFSLIISRHFSLLAYSLFGFTLGIGFNFLAIGIFLALVVVIVFLASLLLYLKVKRVSVSKVLTLRE